MKPEEIMEQARTAIGASRVFGEPYEKNGVTVIPAARVMGGLGGGDAGAKTDDGADPSTPTSFGGGHGFGMVGSPAGAYVIKGGSVRWLPAVDVNRLMFGMQVVLIVFFLVIRSIANARAATPRA